MMAQNRLENQYWYIPGKNARTSDNLICPTLNTSYLKAIITSILQCLYFGLGFSPSFSLRNIYFKLKLQVVGYSVSYKVYLNNIFYL